jgi:hypothetical protein
VFKRDAATLSESISRFVAGNQVSSEVRKIRTLPSAQN